MLERQVEAYLIKQVEMRGGEVRKLSYIGRRGATDRLVLLPGRHFMCELKRPGEKTRWHQAREITKLIWAGVEVCVIDSIEGVDAIL